MIARTPRLARAFAASALALVFLPLGAHAKTPPEVMEPYRAYVAAQKAGDTAAMEASALEAWKASEKALGDHKLTGRLAMNYGATFRDSKATKAHAKALERSRDLALLEDEDQGSAYMMRGLEAAAAWGEIDAWRKAGKSADALVAYAEENGLTDSTFYGEALTMQAAGLIKRRRAEDAAVAAQKALRVFEGTSDGIVTAAPLQARLYVGYEKESDDDMLGAALEYQSIMETVDGVEYGKYPLVDTALGRWIHMRGALRAEGKLEEAEQAGLCQCWPYDKPRNESVQPIKRVPPVMPRYAAQSGYVVFEYDLTDDGTPTGIKVITAWPSYYEEPALKAVEKYEYSPRTTAETDADRTNIVSTVRFMLTDEHGDMIW